MCTVSIHINEEVIRKYNPALSTKELIQQWLQRQVDIMMEDLNVPTASEPPCTYYSSREVIAESQRRMDDITSGRAETIPHSEVRERMEQLIDSYAN